jgi:hypothetical protein
MWRWLILFCLLPRLAVAAIAHSSTTTNNGDTDTLTIANHVIGGGADYALVVVVSLKDSETVTGITWNAGAEALTPLDTDINGDARVYIYYLAAPTAATEDVVISLSGSTRVAAAAHTYTGVHQTTPFRLAAVTTSNGNDNAPTTDVTALAGEMVVDGICQVSAGPDTANGDHQERANLAAVGGGTDTRCASQEKSSAGAVETMGWSMSDIDNWAIVAGPLQVPGAGPTRRVFIVD